MRVNRLDLIRYGKFTDFSIDFGDAPAAGSDFHIIYGPNEAGKSTTFSALLDLLYGIEKRSRYNFKHPYPMMKLGGVLDVNGRATTYFRVKRDVGSLLDAHDNPIADATILSELGGIDRHAFQTMFSLDDDTLEEGGDSILANKGELGELLFSASSGLSALSQRLIGVREDCDAFFKPGGRSHDLSLLKKELDRLKTEREGLDTAAVAYARLLELRDGANDRYTKVKDELARHRERLDQLQKWSRAYPKFQALRATQMDLEPLLDIPEAPVEWDALLRSLALDMARLEGEAVNKARDVEAATVDLAAIVVDEGVLGLGHEIDGLGAMRARYVTAEQDLPARRARRSEVQGAIDAVLRQLERPEGQDAAAMVLGASVRDRLEQLILEQAAIEEGARSARDELDVAQRALLETEARYASSGQAGGASSDAVRHQLVVATEAFRNSDHGARHRIAADEVREKSDLLAAHLRVLRPWQGDAQALEALDVPARTDLERWVKAIGEAVSRDALLDLDIERLEGEDRDIRAQLQAFEGVGGLVTDGDALTIRRDRDQAWQVHKKGLDAETAAAFEALLRRDDEVGAGRFAHVSELAQVNALSVRAASTRTALAAAYEKCAVGAQALSDLRQAVADAIANLSSQLPATWSAEQLVTWSEAREAALTAFSAVARAVDRGTTADADEIRLRAQVEQALHAAGLEGLSALPIETIMAKAAEWLESDARRRAAGDELERLKASVGTRDHAAAAAQARQAVWTESWSAACAACWLGEDGVVPGVATVRRALKGVEDLAVHLAARKDLNYRIEAMEDDQRQYTQVVTGLARAARTLDDGAPARIDQALCAALETARRQSAARAQAAQRRDTLVADLQKIDDAKGLLERQFEAMKAHFDVANQGEVAEKLARLQTRAGLRKQAAEYELDVLQTVEVPDLGKSETLFEAFDLEAVRLEMAQLKIDIDAEDGRARDLFAEFSKAEDSISAVGGDAAAAKLEERRRTILLQIEEGATRWMRLKFGALAAEQGLRLYRDQHRSALLVRASEAFSLVSRGAYRGLSTQAEKDSEVLIALGADGTSKLASELSKGTRFQLYLALRVAGYEEFVATRRPVPFMADDIMETFDDGRAEETLRVFNGMARSGQVIYLTHHKHLVEIARKVCPTVKIHELPVAMR
jgi:uncharacterized protein YhaN